MKQPPQWAFCFLKHPWPAPPLFHFFHMKPNTYLSSITQFFFNKNKKKHKIDIIHFILFYFIVLHWQNHFVYITERSDSFNHLYFPREITSVLFGLFVCLFVCLFIFLHKTTTQLICFRFEGKWRWEMSDLNSSFCSNCHLQQLSPLNVRYIVHRITSWLPLMVAIAIALNGFLTFATEHRQPAVAPVTKKTLFFIRLSMMECLLECLWCLTYSLKLLCTKMLCFHSVHLHHMK